MRMTMITKMQNTITNRTTLGRFDIQGEADLQAAVLHIQTDPRLRASFAAAEVTMLATVASELGRNILKYGGAHGYLLVSWIEESGGQGPSVEMKAVDYGPGFVDVEAALKDHYSTGGTLGLGLPGAARIMDTLEIDSKPGAGAVVTARKWATKRAKPRRT
jgi:serine/threonine-protein kinase RsbT